MPGFATSYINNTLRRRFHEGDAVALVAVKRYSTSTGLHLLAFEASNGAQYAMQNFVVGLFTNEDAAIGIAAFKEHCAHTNGEPVKFSERNSNQREYIRRQVIPLEWKSLSDEALDERLTVWIGTVHPLTPEK